MDKMREEFEAHYKKEINPDGPFTQDGIPVGFYAAVYWKGWQAARADLVVTLPEPTYEGWEAYEVYEALEKAGIKYE